MTFIHLLFYAFAAVAIFSGMMVVASRNAVRGVLFLVVTFVSTACIWMLLHAEFLALILVLVYVGAVMTLFLFVVMMLSMQLASLREGFVRYLPLSALIVLLVVAALSISFGPKHFGLTEMPMPPLKPSNYSNVADLGMVLYTNYAFPFEVAGALLLTAIIAAISLTHRKAHRRKTQDPAKQIAVQAKHRMRLIDMPSEKKLNPTNETPA